MPLAASARTPANGPGIGSTATPLAREADDAIAGIADDRHAGVADDGDDLPSLDTLDELRRPRILGVLIEAVGRRLDAEVPEELARVPRVFAEDERRRVQRLDGARRKIAEVAEGRAYDEELAGHAAECTSRASSSVSATILRDSSSFVGRSMR